MKLGFDEDNDNKPDVLDFDGVEQLYINSSGSTVSGAVSFMVWVSELATQSSPDIITTNLTAGTDYSVEFSKNFAEPLGARIPDIEILDPSGVLVSTDLTLSTYPAEQPAVVVYTFTPETSGTYTIRLCNADNNTESDSETNGVLFVYREMLNSKGETGYYERFLLSNADGSIQTEASRSEIVQLCKNFVAANPFYLDEVYGQDNDNGTRSRNNSGGDITQNMGGYDDYMKIMNSASGIADDDEETESAEVSAAATGESSISTMVTGIPYDNDYLLGRGLRAEDGQQLQLWSDKSCSRRKPQRSDHE